jgi:hypothetical protein
MNDGDKTTKTGLNGARMTQAGGARNAGSFGRRQWLAAGSILLVLLVSIFWIGGRPASAQTTAGSIVGSLTDPTGAVLPNAQVTLTNIQTDDTRLATTNQSGFYQFVNVPPGSYRISVQKQGFKQLIREPIELQVASTIQIDLAVQIGSENQNVLVTTGTPLIQAETTSLGDVIDQRETNEIPLNGRNPMNLAALVPSVVPQGQASGTPTGTNVFAWGNYQIGGGMANQSATYLDGSPLNATYNNIMALVPTQDSLQEFKVATNNVSPEYGHLAGGVINFTTKSGTNDLHGNLWEFIRNKVFNANTFFSDQAKLPNPPFTQNQYGLNVGGPVFVPHVFNGRNKTFFFVDWEGFALRQGQTFTETVPTADERKGILTALDVPIYDPQSTCGVAGGPPCPPGTPQYNRLTEFENGVIPPGQLNATAVAYLNTFYPLPSPGATSSQDNFTANTSVGGNNYQAVAHIDQNISDKQHMSGRYTYWVNKNLPINPLGTGICYDRCGETFTTNNFVLQDTYAFNRTTILDMHLSYLRNVYSRLPLLSNFNPTSIDWPAYQFEFPGPPDLWIPSFDPAGIFISAGVDNVIQNTGDSDRIGGDVTKFVGNHTLQFGGEFMRQTLNAVANSWNTGIFAFTAGFTSQNPETAVGGSDLASYLLGNPDLALQATTVPTTARLFYPGFYATDAWRATSRLTFNLGVRWESDLPFTERHNRLSYFDPSAVSPILAAAGLNDPGAVELVASSTRSSRYQTNRDLEQFSPRVGIAYEITPSTVFSVGYGIFWLPMDVGNQSQPTGDEINAGGTPYLASLNGGLTPNPNATLSNPWPNGFVQPPGRTNYDATLLGTGLLATFLNNPYPYAQQWNAGIQQQIGTTFMFHVAYGGAKGTHLPFYSAQMDQVPDADLSQGLSLLNQVPNPFYGVISPSYGLGLPTVAAYQLLTPYPQYSGVAMASADLGASTYNSLQVTAQKRLPAGASLNLAYTWSKLISNTDTLTGWLEPEVAGGSGGIQDANNLRGERSLSSDDATQRLVLSYVYDVPVGRGRRLLSDAPRALDYAIGGWGLDGVTTFMTGFPLGFTASQNLNLGGLQRPNYTSGCAKSVSGSAYSKLNKWFDTACFTQPAVFTYGNESRNDSTLRADGQANWDAALFKNFAIDSEGKKYVQFRFETFNLFNRVQFGYPGDTQGLPNFGVVSSQANSPRILQFALRVNY